MKTHVDRAMMYEQKVYDLTAKVLAGRGEEVVWLLGAPLEIEWPNDFSWEQIRNPKKLIMEAVARQVVPSNWRWEVYEVLGGECYFILSQENTTFSYSPESWIL